MQRAMIGLGRMGGNMAERLLKGGHEVVVYDRSAEAVRARVAKGARGAMDLDVPAPVITLALLARLRSRQTDSFGAKVIAALRNEFGGHAVRKA